MKQVKIKGVTVTADMIVDAMSRYQHEKITTKAQKFYILHDRKKYPPKKIVSLATGLPVSGFSGGSAINRPLTNLGFKIIGG